MESPSPQSTPPSLEHLEGQDAGLFRMLKAEVESLREMAKRTQVKGLKESVDQVVSIIASIEQNNIELRAVRSQSAGTKLTVVDARKVVSVLSQNLNTAVKESNKIVLDAISSIDTRINGANEAGGTANGEVKAAVANLQTMLQAQSVKMDEMAEWGIQTSWTEVVRNKGKKKEQDGKPDDKPAATRQQRVRTRPPAILVQVGKEEFPALVHKIRGTTNRDVIGDHVVGMRQTKSGDLLIEIKGDPEQVEAVRAEVSRSAGEDIEVRTLQQKALLEIRDLDQWASQEEVIDAVAMVTGANRDAVRTIGLRKCYGGTQTALVIAPAALCRNVLLQGRIRVGMVNCRVRQGVSRARCFRCLSFGHTSKDCGGPDRSKWCKRCGSQSHFAKDCNASASEAEAFGKILEKESVTKSSANASKSVDPSSR